ncbi:MAG: hypothetical protein FD153_1833 [Rhodospirillaceae bacterium]|nr:MAG: hypothetical protein FD153_1833 [Rhodospirillaceae bacterium]
MKLIDQFQREQSVLRRRWATVQQRGEDGIAVQTGGKQAQTMAALESIGAAMLQLPMTPSSSVFISDNTFPIRIVSRQRK